MLFFFDLVSFRSTHLQQRTNTHLLEAVAVSLAAVPERISCLAARELREDGSDGSDSALPAGSVTKQGKGFCLQGGLPRAMDVPCPVSNRISHPVPYPLAGREQSMACGRPPWSGTRPHVIFKSKVDIRYARAQKTTLVFRGNHLSNTTCPTRVFLKSDE